MILESLDDADKGVRGIVVLDGRGQILPGEVRQPASTVRAEVVMSLWSNCQESTLETETVAILACVTGCDKLIHEADDERMVRQLLEGASNAGALMFGNAVGLTVQSIAKISHLVNLIVHEYTRNHKPLLVIEQVLLFIGGAHDGVFLSVGVG